MMIILIILLLGVALGSFVNACVWRLHEQAKSKKTDKSLSILHGRSMCVHCKHTLAAKDLIPILSWVELRGKCRYCHKPISGQYPLIELITGLLFVGSYLLWPYGFELAGATLFGFWLIILVFFMVLILTDLKWMLLPNRVVYPLIGVIAVSTLVQVAITGHPDALWQALWGVVCLFGTFWLLFQISDGKWIGGGDVKLAIALGMLVGGPVKALLVIFVASLLGVIVSIPLLSKNKKALSSKVPFGPFLIVATIIVFLFGTYLVDWYTRTLIGA